MAQPQIDYKSRQFGEALQKDELAEIFRWGRATACPKSGIYSDGIGPAVEGSDGGAFPKHSRRSQDTGRRRCAGDANATAGVEIVGFEINAA